MPQILLRRCLVRNNNYLCAPKSINEHFNYMRLARIIAIAATIILLTNCEKNSAPYVYNYTDTANRTYRNSLDRVKFISEDSLIWYTSAYRETESEYRVSYEINGNNIQFEVADTIRTDYVDPVIGSSYFTTATYFDLIKGTFVDINTIDAYDVKHGYTTYYEDLYMTSSGAGEFHTTLIAE